MLLASALAPENARVNRRIPRTENATGCAPGATSDPAARPFPVTDDAVREAVALVCD